MKQRFFHILLIALFIMAIPFHSSGFKKDVDFNFPKDVSTNALADLDKALKSGDGQLTVDALVRYSIAQSGISQDNMPDIIDQLEKVIKKEKRPEYKSLLYLFEAMVYDGYCDRYAYYRDRNNPVEETPTDVSEWSREQFQGKIVELIVRSIENPEALRQIPVTDMPDILVYNQLGVLYTPTLFEFMSRESYDMLSGNSFGYSLRQQIKDRWLAMTEDRVPAHIFAMTYMDANVNAESYQKYKDNETSALLLKKLYYLNEKEKYDLYKDYVKRFPKSIYTPEIANMITEIEKRTVSLSFPEIRNSHDSIPITMSVSNTNSFNIALYRITSDVDDDIYVRKGYESELVATYPITVKGTVPFTDDNVKLTLPPLPYGIYTLSATGLAQDKESGSGHGEFDRYNLHLLRVTDMAMMFIKRHDDKDKVGIVDIKSGKPVPSVTVKYEDRKSDDKKITGTVGKTNADGLVTLPTDYPDPDNPDRNFYFSGLRIQASKGQDQYGEKMGYYKLNSHFSSSSSCEMFTDLGVYRPGETVHWAAIAHYNYGIGPRPLAEDDAEIIFKDHNGKLIDKLKAKTDAFGRVEGSFVIPKDRMNGEFSLEFNIIYENGQSSRIGWKRVNVSEYKTPTFEVTFPDNRHNYVSGQPVKITGKAETYSGMPVANTEVRLSLIQNEWRWRWWYVPENNGKHLLDTIVKTDAQGMFTFSFDPDLFSENDSRYGWARYNYQVVATATSDAGETHEESFSFIVGTRRGIELGRINGNVFFNDKPITLPLQYNTTDEEHPNTYCTWEVFPMGSKEPVKTGNLNTADPTIDLTDLPSGQYKLKVHILDAADGEDDVDAETNITLYRKTDKEPPVKDEPIWVSPLSGDVDKANTAHITIGVSVPKVYIYYVASTAEKVIAEGWLNYTNGMHDFTVPLPKEAGADVTVVFSTYYETKKYSASKRLTNPYKAEAVKISATSFRDKLAPGDIEHWTFTLTDQNDKPLRGAMILDMYDKAIASIAGNDWGWSNWRRGGLAGELSAQGVSGFTNTRSSWIGKMLDEDEKSQAILPYLYTYETYPFSRWMGNARGGARGRDERIEYLAGAAPERMMSKSARVLNDEANMDEIKAEEETAAQPTVNEENLEKVVLRENDVKTALWQPMLTSNDKGQIQLEFEVPNFNTTWITQALAWNENLVGSTWMAEVLTQKPLMVRANMPRFLRQGDKAQLAATVQNASDKAAKCDAVIELFDPRTGDIYATRKFNLELEPMGSQAVKIDWTVPDTISFTGFRIKAANGRYGDGEQVMVPVLTTISPVIETQPFYIEAAQSHYQTTLPEFPKDARVTLEYCDNPVWYCVLALPTIFSDSYCTATNAAHSLFALQVAQAVAKSQPQIKEAINYWKEHDEDSTLVSMLEKNQDLKIGTLLASPWVRDADRQTLRMSKLHELFDDEISSREYEKILAALQSLQMPDGGFTWFRHPECKSSLWATGTVLELIGKVKHLGGLPDDSRMASMLDKAVKYFDSKTMEEYLELKKVSARPEANFMGYAYVRNFFPEQQIPKDNAKLVKKTVKYMDKTWSKGISLKNKAFYALTLNRNGHEKTAQKIIESIRQFAIVKPNTGMYWDNLQNDYGWDYDKIAYTSSILQAMSEVDPRQDEIDQVRKWMLLMKQTNDWGSSSLAADAVHTILSTGSQWLERNTLPSITVAGQPMNLDKMAEWLGYFRTSIDATTAGDVVIDRNGNGPAWGSIYCQYKSPMTEVQEKAIEEVSISKEYYVYAQDGSLHQATSFKVGDKVKVRVIIKTNKDMDYVSITDERAACFEPVDKLSGYRSEDRTWFYLETKDTQTNVFINRLNKGTHIIGYDVWVTNPGEFTSGIATIQSQYAPQMTAHSAGKAIITTPK